MKKIITLFTCIIISSALLAQTEHLKFKGIPIDGTLEKFSEALIEIGFELNEDSKEDEMFLIGDFAGYKDCRVYVSTLDNIDLVNFVSVAFPDRDSWSSLLRDYTSLKDMLTEKYGDPSDSVEDFYNKEARSDSDMLFEIRTDNYDYHSVFNTDRGEIVLSVEHYTFFFTEHYYVSIQYYDKMNSNIIKEHAIKDL